MKTLKLILTAVAIFVLASCSNDIDLDLQNENLPYLAIDENADFQNLSNEEKSVIFNALQRIKITRNKDGLYEMSAKRACDINVSESIFRFFKSVIDTSNEYISCPRSQVISRSAVSNGKDCLTYAFMNATGIMNYSLISGHITRILGPNVEPDTANLESILNDPEFISQVGAGQMMNLDQFTTPEEISKRVVIIYRDPENMEDAHAVNGMWQPDLDNFMIRDYQKNPTNGEVKLIDRSWIIQIVGF